MTDHSGLVNFEVRTGFMAGSALFYLASLFVTQIRWPPDCPAG
ncbi:hypothetical protein AmDm5_1160 [Acetobacter malorum]|nr:hypothetical protein AmDm5_1160 [Acetobacter malorum]